MSVTTIQRDTNNNVSLVRMTATDSLATVASTNYIANQQANINVLNGGDFAWFLSDMVLVAASDGNAFYYFKTSTFATLVIYGEQGSGTVNPGLINQVAYYAANGSSLSGLATLASGVLVTSAGGVPSISQTLPATVQGNITALGTITSGVWNGTPITVPYGGTGNTTFTAYTLICAGTTATGTFQNVVSVGNLGDVLISNGAGALPTFQAGVASGIINTGNLNDLPYYSANPSGKTLSAIAGANSSVLITSGLGVPSLSQTLPNAVQGNITILGTIATGVWHGTVISPTYGGTGLSNPTAHGIMVAEGASNMTPIVLSSGQLLIGSTGADPVAAAIGSGTGILVGNGAGSISVSLASIADQRILANISGGAAAPTANTLTAIIDACIGSVQGDILYRNAASWVVLAPGTSGQFLQTQGAAANPQWTTSATVTPAALTKTDDTNVTMTLGGTPATALLQATSLTLGWSGQLAITRGGTGVNAVTVTPTASAWAGWDSNKNISANRFGSGYRTTVTAAATTTLSVTDAYQQYFTGSTTQTVLMPVASTIALGDSFYIVNNSSGVVTVQSSGGNTIQAMAANTTLLVTCILSSGTTAASWNAEYVIESALTLPLSLANGGTNAALVANNGGIVYSTATALAILAGTATANLPLLSGSSSAPSWGAFAISLGGALTTAGAHTLSGAFASTFIFTNTTSVTFPTSGTLATTSQIPTGAALTKTDDANVTLTLGGSPTTALVNAASLTLGWTGQLSLARGGTNASLTAANGAIPYSTASAIALLAAGTSGQLFQSGGVGAPNWTTSTYPGTSGTARKMLVSDGTNNVYSTETWAVPGTSGNVLTSNGTNWISAAPATGSVKFSASTAGHANVTGDGTDYTCIFESTYINTGTAYNTATGVFTAPSTGLYNFSASIALSSIAVGNTGNNTWFQQAGSASNNFYILDVIVTAIAVSNEIIFSGSANIYLTASDTVTLHTLVNGTPKGVNLAAQSLFSGFLIA